jgi:hypothetical protein
VLTRFLFGIACLFGTAFVSISSTSWAANLTLQLYPLTGEMRLLNSGSTPIPFIFYEIASPSGGLNSANGVWTSISDTFDASGNGFIDSTSNWTELPLNTTKLAEGVVVGPGGSLLPYRSIGLGRVWNPNIATPASIIPTFVQSQGQNAIPMDKTLVVDGDYTTVDLSVDQQDYAVWSLLYGATNFPMADGNHDGVVNAADYTVWRDNLGAHYVGSGLGNASGGGALAASAVPEPTGVSLALLGSSGALGGWMFKRRNFGR